MVNRTKTEHFSKNNGIFDEKKKKKKALPRVENLGCITVKVDS